MLVLSRKLGERIVIGQDVTITVVRVSGNRVSLGIEAPADVRVIRAELLPIVDAFRNGVEIELGDLTPTSAA